MRDIQLLLNCGMGPAKVNEMITLAKREFVMSHHPRDIFRLPPSSSWKNGCYKTYVYVDSKRKELTANTKEKLLEKLYDFYYEAENKAKTLEQVFEMYMDYKLNCLNRRDNTVETDRTRFRHIPDELLNKDINDITDEDIHEDFIHVHRQQVKLSEGTRKRLVEVGYTKDERMHPHNGRFIPITEEARRVIDLAKAIPGDSPYLFHERNCSKMIPKDGYAQNLRKRCRRLGCVPTNNHAFRMAFNSRLIELGFSASDRALILGHEVQTNESHYSLTDKRKLDVIRDRLVNNEVKNEPFEADQAS